MAYAATVDSKHLGRLFSSKLLDESFDSSLPDLIADLLVDEVNRRFRNSLSIDFHYMVREQARVRGRILHLKTARERSLDKGRVFVKYETITFDNQVNRLALYALNLLHQTCLREDARKACRKAISKLELAGVTSTLDRAQFRGVEATDKRDLRLVAFSRLAISSNIPTEFVGSGNLVSIDYVNANLPKIYEKALFGFFKTHLDSSKFLVEFQKKPKWKISEATAGFEQRMPDMIMDIRITNLASREVVIIDAKFKTITRENFGSVKFKSEDLYQMYSYMHSQSAPGLPKSTSGALIYPTIGDDVFESAKLQGFGLTLVSLNLGLDPAEMRLQLLKLVHSLIPSDTEVAI